MDNKKIEAIVNAIIEGLYDHEFWGFKLQKATNDLPEIKAKTMLVNLILNNPKARRIICDAIDVEDILSAEIEDESDELEELYWETHYQLKAINKLLGINKFFVDMKQLRPLTLPSNKELFDAGDKALNILLPTREVVNKRIKNAFKNYLFDSGVVNKAYAFENYDGEESELSLEDYGLSVQEEEPAYNNNSSIWRDCYTQVESLKKRLTGLHSEERYKARCIQDTINELEAFMAKLESDSSEERQTAYELKMSKLQELRAKAQADSNSILLQHYTQEIKNLKAKYSE